jgi:O-antigen/teichoic acid export membrane protein
MVAGGSQLAPAAIRRRLARVGPDGLGGRAGWASVVEVLQLASSVLVFLILARLLTEADYGVLGAVLGVAMTAASLSNVGSHILLIKRAAQGHDLADAWRRATSVGILGPAAGALALIALRPVILPSVDPWVYGLLVVSQLNFFWLTELAVFIGNGTRQLKESAQLRFIVVCCRFVALVLFALLGDGRLIVWAIASVASFGIGAVLSLLYVWRVFGLAPGLWTVSRADVVEGAPFAANASSESLVDVSDRPLLLRYGHSVDAGIYTLGGRIVQFGYLPVRILLRASDADLFEAGRHGTRRALEVSRSLLKPGIAIGLAVGAGFLVFAPVVPIVVGDKYAEAVDTMRLLAVMPAIRAVQYLMGNCLSASDHQWWRVGATLAAAALNFGLNIWLLPTGTWRTAVFTTIVSELFLAAALSLVVYVWAWRERLADGDS